MDTESEDLSTHAGGGAANATAAPRVAPSTVPPWNKLINCSVGEEQNTWI